MGRAFHTDEQNAPTSLSPLLTAQVSTVLPATTHGRQFLGLLTDQYLVVIVYSRFHAHASFQKVPCMQAPSK